MSMGFMILAMILSLVLLLAMGFSFRPALRRLNKTDLVFSTLSSFTANCEMLQPRPHISYLVTTYLSWGAGALMLWAGEGGVSAGQGVGLGASVAGRALDRTGVDPTGGQPTGTGRGLGGHLAPPLPPPGILSYLNYMGMWGKGTPSMERRMSYRRWASLQSTRKSISEPSSDAGSKHTEDLSV
ncbi:uncharacterized protein ACBT57_010280 isoform 2-T3 [Dama dama]|uniref:uncharacterized protein LOC133054723 isoform X1 n=1 Tax=Dama dama TaxID=30532 RepID=UPI002A35A977|nr:uncharacterized protein LOC133054723 isoform X1 [Dama dama]